MNVSVVICTHNNEGRLAQTLASLARSDIDHSIRWEALVVDNNSTDGTAQTVKQIISEGSGQFRYFFEARQGKGYALNTGVRAATGQVVAFTDDDAIASPTWLEACVREFERDPSLAGLGGMVTLHDTSDQPTTIRTSPDRFELSWKQLQVTNIPIIGCNMAFRASVFAQVGLFDERFGPGGAVVPSGADMDFVYRVCRSGLKVIYSPDVILAHNHGRTTEGEIQALRRRYLRGRGGFYCKHILAGDRIAFQKALSEVYGTGKDLVDAVFNRKPTGPHAERLRLLLEGARTYMRLSRQRQVGK